MRATGNTVSRFRAALDMAASVGMIAASCVLIWAVLYAPHPAQPADARGSPMGPQIPGEPISIEGTIRKGDSGAPVVVIEFADFECPFCAKAAQSVLPVLDTYIEKGLVQLVFRHLPLEIHPNAWSAAQAAECASSEDKFWAMHDALFTSVGDLTSNSLVTHARSIDLDVSEFSRCLSGAPAGRIEKDIASARLLRIESTPTFLFGKREPDGRARVVELITGVPNSRRLQGIVDELLR